MHRVAELQVELPQDQLEQDEEFCEVVLEGQRRRIRFHDYAEIYRLPGLYERLFDELLQCRSPEVVARLLVAGRDAGALRVLDFGAGNGMVGEALRRRGVGHVVGCDLLPEAREAALRDRPGVYDEYVACDITDDASAGPLQGHDLNAMTCVAALGFGDVPPAAFVAALEHVPEDGAVVFNIKEDFLEGERSGFAELLERALRCGLLEERVRERYVHRLAVDGRPLHYVAIDAVKRGDIPRAWLGA